MYTYAWEHADNMIVKRLLRTKPDDLPLEVVEREYTALVGVIEVATDKVLGNMSQLIPGFTEGDLRSIFVMKAYQIIREGKYDPTIRPYAIFSVAFRNVVRDILRSHNRAVERGLERSAFDFITPAFSVDDRTSDSDEELTFLAAY